MEAPICPKHKTAMSQGTNNPDQWYCPRKDPSGKRGYCEYRVTIKPPVAAAPAQAPLDEGFVAAITPKAIPLMGPSDKAIVAAAALRFAAEVMKPTEASWSEILEIARKAADRMLA